MYASVFDIAERRNAVFHSVYRHICITRCVLLHSFQYTARCREETRAAAVIIVHYFFRRYIFLFEQLVKLFKRQHCVGGAFIILSLILFCDARTDKHRFCIRMAALYIRAVCLHRRIDISETAKHRRKILLNQQVDRVAA